MEMNADAYYTDENGGSIMKQVDTLVGMCIQKGYVSQDEAPWLRYALERRVTSIIAFVPLYIYSIY